MKSYWKTFRVIPGRNFGGVLNRIHVKVTEKNSVEISERILVGFVEKSLKNLQKIWNKPLWVFTKELLQASSEDLLELQLTNFNVELLGNISTGNPRMVRRKKPE